MDKPNYIEEPVKQKHIHIKNIPDDVKEIINHAKCKIGIDTGVTDVTERAAVLQLIRNGNMGLCGGDKKEACNE